jgi:hypothetical protein
MKPIYKRAYRLVLVCLLKTFFCFAQPVIKVPPTCEVVYAGFGTGVTTGFGGIVGDGGIVAMPDPFDFTTDEGYFYYVPNGTELIEWNLLGDISMQTESPYNNVLQPAGPINPLNIQSYNKNLRLSENPSTSQPLLKNRWGRSKGRVIVIYNNKRCNVSIKFDILKRYKQNPDKKDPSVVPPIFGSDCVLPNTVYTYSVDQIASDNPDDEIGFDKYYWSGLPEGSLKLYNSTDNSSITFLTGDYVSSFTLQCCYGRANEWDGDAGSSHATCITKQVSGELAQPAFINPPPDCLPSNQTTFTIAYPNSMAGQTYIWTAPNTGWNLSTTSASGITTLTVNTNGSTNPGTLILTISGGCNPAIYNYQIIRSITTPFIVVPTGATSTCINSTSTNNTYTLSPNVGDNSIEWFTTPAVIAGVTLVNANTPTVTVNTSNSAAGSFILHARSNIATCNSTNTFTTINVRPAPPVFITTTPSCVPLSSPALTTFAVTPGAASYTWTLPSGWTCTGNCTTANPTLVPPLNNSTVGAPAMPPATISVVANSATGCSSVATNFTVNYFRINSNTLQSGTGNCDQYSINTNATSCLGAISSWSVGGVTAVSNGSTVNIFGNTLTLCGNTAIGAGSVCANVIVNGVNYSTCSSMVATGTHGLKQATPKTVLEGIVISPNPNNGNFSIKVDDFLESATAILTDVTGKEISSHTLNKGENKIQNEQIVQGTYFVILLVDGKQETRQIIVE